MGNVGSILNMLKKIGVEVTASKDSSVIDKADKLILPGVGTYDKGMSSLLELGLIEGIRYQTITKGKPLLGICLGMQLLGRKSEEGHSDGLSLIDFDNKRFSLPEESTLKIPHMGWDVVSFQMADPLLDGINQMQRYYFVHSYHAVCDNTENILMNCDYGYTFPAAVKKDNIYGVQFHPEKSHKFGMALLENFARRV